MTFKNIYSNQIKTTKLIMRNYITRLMMLILNSKVKINKLELKINNDLKLLRL